MKSILVSLVVFSVAACYAQQDAYEKFVKENPSGKNKFGRTFDEQRKYEENFNMQSFLDFTFGDDISKYTNGCSRSQSEDRPRYGVYSKKLDTPFMMLKNMKIGESALRRLWEIKLHKDSRGLVAGTGTDDVRKLVAFFEEKYKILFVGDDKRLRDYMFSNKYVQITIDRKSLSLVGEDVYVTIRRRDLFDFDTKKVAEEQKRKEEAQQKRKLAAREELAGWPKEEFDDRSELDIFGTNVESVIEKCCGRVPSGVVVRADVDTKIRLLSWCGEVHKFIMGYPHGFEESSWNWTAGQGWSYIEQNYAVLWEEVYDKTGLRNGEYNCHWKKYDENGRLVKRARRVDFEEYAWVTNQHSVITARLKDLWAKSHGLTREQAEGRVMKLKAVLKGQP